MRKILQIRENQPGGTDNYCKSLYNMFKDDKDCQILPLEDIPNIPSHLFHYYYSPRMLRNAMKKADIVHINGYTAMGTVMALIMARRLHKKVVYTAHWHPFEYIGHPLLGKMFFHLVLRPVIIKCANVVTTINNEDTRFFKGFHDNVRQIPHWYIPKLFIDVPKKKKKMILFVGRVNDPVKNIKQLYSLPENVYEVHCVGKGNIERKDFHQHINIPDEELARLYAEASLLVIPSKYEAFSYVALEAMAYGTPVVMSDRVRIADYLSGFNGYATYHYGDTSEFLNKVEETINSTVESKEVLERFSPQKIGEEYKKLYMSL